LTAIFLEGNLQTPDTLSSAATAFSPTAIHFNYRTAYAL